MIPSRVEFSRMLKEWRKEQNLTQKDAAEKLGIEVEKFNAYERARITPRSELVHKVNTLRMGKNYASKEEVTWLKELYMKRVKRYAENYGWTESQLYDYIGLTPIDFKDKYTRVDFNGNLTRFKKAMDGPGLETDKNIARDVISTFIDHNYKSMSAASKDMHMNPSYVSQLTSSENLTNDGLGPIFKEIGARLGGKSAIDPYYHEKLQLAGDILARLRFLAIFDPRIEVKKFFNDRGYAINATNYSTPFSYAGSKAYDVQGLRAMKDEVVTMQLEDYALLGTPELWQRSRAAIQKHGTKAREYLEKSGYKHYFIYATLKNKYRKPMIELYAALKDGGFLE